MPRPPCQQWQRHAHNAGFAQTVHMLFLIKHDLVPLDADDRTGPGLSHPAGERTLQPAYDNTVELEGGTQEAINQLC